MNVKATPEFELYRQFRLSVIFWRHPERLLLWAAVMFLFTPDIQYYVGDFVRNAYLSDYATIWLGSFMLFFGLPLSQNYIEYKKYPLKFYKDHLELRNSLLIPEKMIIPYKQVTDVSSVSNIAQKLNRVETLKIYMRTSNDHRKRKDYCFEVADLKRKTLRSANLSVIKKD